MSFLSKLAGLFGSAKKRVDLNERFQLVREAVNGTMSSFHQAIDKTTGKAVGLKILDTEKTAQFESRFKLLGKPSEGTVSLAMKHPRIVETYEAGTLTDGRPYLVMEFIQGTVLNTLINQRSPLLNGKRHIIIRQMAEAIEAVHKAGYIHRDICPRNFIASPDCTEVKLIDFGLTLPASKDFQQPGNRTGTPLYLSPEIVRRKVTDQRVDIFSYGVSCYQLCTNEFPWPASDVTGRGALQHDSHPPTPITEYAPNLHPTLAKLIMQCISAEPANRPPSFDVILKQLKNVNSDEAPKE